jgi:hypothetical protein
MTLDIAKLTSLSNEERQAVAEAFDGLEHWRSEIRAANERCLTKVLDQVANAHRALGWPEQATNAAKEHFLKASSNLWIEAAQAWQRAWISTMFGGALPEPMTSTRRTEFFAREGTPSRS